jgi:hypothetical protein
MGRSIVGQIEAKIARQDRNRRRKNVSLTCFVHNKEGLIEMKAEQTEATVRSELDGQALLGDLRRFVEEAELSIP